MTLIATPLKLTTALVLALGISGCAGTPNDTATRNAPLQTSQQPMSLALNVQSIKVDVPRTLKVSEKNRYYPGGDIVWREDPLGDRYAQVQAIVADAMAKGTAGMDTGVPVELDIEVKRFHALTQKARYTTGGVHALTFVMTLRDPATGMALSEPREIVANFKAYGGSMAVVAEQRGETQKVRITKHLANVIRQEMTEPGSYQAAQLGLMGVMN
ncbi:hypothetical protein O4H61_02870 [Roseovarius aestuarii]|nr:hypothetical protein [Roseovarius aestuarii]